MKKIVKKITIIMIIVIVICGIYYALNKNYFKKKKAVEADEKNYGEEYMEFKSAVYKEKRERICQLPKTINRIMVTAGFRSAWPPPRRFWPSRAARC